MNDLNQANATRKSNARRTSSARFVLAAAVALVGGTALVGVGVRWHQPIARWFGADASMSAGAASVEPAGHGRSHKQLWTCGMHPQVIQDHPGDCPICHMKLTPLAGDDADDATAAGPPKVAYWWDPMLGPSSIAHAPGKSAMGMELVPVYEKEVAGGTGVKINPVVVQNMGVRVATISRGPVTQTIRAVGYLAEAQPLVHDVNLRVSGWIETLHVATEGEHVAKGDPLFELYSPEVQVAVQELILAQKSMATAGAAMNSTFQPERSLVESSRDKLAQWGLDAKEIDRLAVMADVPRTVTLTSPITGHVTVKNVVEGSAVKAGDRVMQIVDHSTLWLDAQVFEQDLPFIRLGQNAEAKVEALPGVTLEGPIIFIHPHIDPDTRTATVRIALPNPDMRLRPGMYASLAIASRLQADAILAPREAIIDTGTRSIAFLSMGDGRFEPREVKVGSAAGDGMVEVLSGLAPDDVLVTSGQFLLDSESRMREAIQRHLNQGVLMPDPGNVASTAPASEPISIPSMTGMATAATSPPMQAMSAAQELYAAYLDLAEQLMEVPDRAAIDAKGAIAAAQRLIIAAPDKSDDLPRRALEAAMSLDGQSADAGRTGFKTLSEVVIAMLDVHPPDAGAGDGLIVAHCPMAFGTGADWLQKGEAIANPYLPAMRTCGSVVRPANAVGRSDK